MQIVTFCCWWFSQNMNGLLTSPHHQANVAFQHLQEVVRQLPESAQYRSMLSKQWTDCTYLDVGPAHEKLTDDDRRQFNQTALEHARQVQAFDPHWVRMSECNLQNVICPACDTAFHTSALTSAAWLPTSLNARKTWLQDLHSLLLTCSGLLL